MKKVIALLMMSAFLVSGCATYIDPFPKVLIGGGGGHHCPPGHAKKGHC